MAFGLIDFLGHSKEKDTLDLLKKHMIKIVQTKDLYLEAYEAYINSNNKKAEIKVSEVREKEHEADLICKSIIRNLYEGAFLPNMRSDIYRMVDELDTVADNTQNAANMIPYMEVVKLNKELKNSLNELSNCLSKSVDLLKKTIYAFLDDNEEEFKKTVEALKAVEEEADKAQKGMYDELIFGKHDPKTLHVVSAFGHFMATVCDAADNTCDNLELLKITHG